MKTKKKAFGLILAAVLLVCVSVLGTVAYLTSTDEVNNTFTVGNVNITLNEAPVNEAGEIVEGDRVQNNEYHLLPGHTYNKDPMVTVKAGSDESYVRMIVTINKASALKAIDANFLPEKYVKDWNRDTWICKSISEKDDTLTYEFWYKDTVTAPVNEDLPLDPLFTQIVMPGTITNAQLATLEGLNVNVVADAIQADGFKDAEAAWAAFDEE